MWECDSKGVADRPVKTGCWFVDDDFDWSFARLIAPVFTITSIVLSCKIKPANAGSPGRMTVKTERSRELLSKIWRTHLIFMSGKLSSTVSHVFNKNCATHLVSVKWHR